MVVAVLMVHCEQMPVFMVELSGAFGTNEPVDEEGLFPIGAVGGGGRGASFFENIVNRFIDGRLLQPS